MAIRKNIAKSVSNKLYGLSAARCNICNILVYEGKNINLGQMAHNNSYSKGGPRAINERLEDNSYENLILLCANDHLRVDGDEEYYTTELIQNIKNIHENRIKTNNQKGDDPDKKLISICFNSINFQKVFNCLQYSPAYIQFDVTDLSDFYNNILLKYHPSLYPFQDNDLNDLVDCMIDEYIILSKYLLNGTYVDNPGVSFSLPEMTSDAIYKILSETCLKLREYLLQFISYCKEKFNISFNIV